MVNWFEIFLQEDLMSFTEIVISVTEVATLVAANFVLVAPAWANSAIAILTLLRLVLFLGRFLVSKISSTTLATSASDAVPVETGVEGIVVTGVFCKISWTERLSGLDGGEDSEDESLEGLIGPPPEGSATTWNYSFV